MDRRESQVLGLLDIGQGVVDKQTLPGGLFNLIEQDLEDLRVRLDVADFA